MRLFRYRIIRQVKDLDPNLFLLNCRALLPGRTGQNGCGSLLKRA
jgi:hypothetical protein